jgi:uncharacterized protein YjbI with pentapeptide repeats
MDQEQLDILKQKFTGVKVWNQWRREHSIDKPNLSGADLSNADLRNADLSNADLSSANLKGANLYRANLKDARQPHFLTSAFDGEDTRYMAA